MIVVKLFGGLGNQMFQYAVGKALALKNDTELYLDIDNFHYDIRSYELSVFNIDANIATQVEKPFYERVYKHTLCDTLRYPFRRFAKKINPSHIFENSKHPLIHKGMYDFNPNIPQLTKKYVYLEGNRGSEKYFEKYIEVIKNDFSLKEKIQDKRNIEIIEEIKNSEAISLHIRRSDYLGTPLEVCDLDYYLKAIDYINCHISDPTYIVFSDDIEWCRTNLHLTEKHYFIDRNHGEDAYKDMVLMSTCKHHIIANSSFSRRGAQLGGNPHKIVIAPQKRHQQLDYADIIPASRTKI